MAGRRAIDVSGQQFGSLTVKCRDQSRIGKNAWWTCECDCGNLTSVTTQSLQAGRISSCGCRKSDKLSELATTHGMSRSRTYKSWIAMRERCLVPTHMAYPRYGGRGITICERWKDSFENFLADMGERPEGKTLDRYPDKNGPYSIENCRWATPKEQSRNRNDNKLTASDVDRIRNVEKRRGARAELARELGVNFATIHDVLTGRTWKTE